MEVRCNSAMTSETLKSDANGNIRGDEIASVEELLPRLFGEGRGGGGRWVEWEGEGETERERLKGRIPASTIPAKI